MECQSHVVGYSKALASWMCTARWARGTIDEASVHVFGDATVAGLDCDAADAESRVAVVVA